METRLLIRGEQVAGEGPALAVENPATEETVTELGAASPEQLDAAIAAAREAAPGWAATPAVERAELLHEVATRMRALTDELARVLTLEGGKPLIENSDEVGWTAAAFDYYAEMGRNFAGRVIPLDRVDPAGARRQGADRRRGARSCPGTTRCCCSRGSSRRRWPRATRWSAKPSELTPVSTLMLAECFADLPPGVVNVVAGAGDVGAALVEDPRIDGVAFTGLGRDRQEGRGARAPSGSRA